MFFISFGIRVIITLSMGSDPTHRVWDRISCDFTVESCRGRSVDYIKMS